MTETIKKPENMSLALLQLLSTMADLGIIKTLANQSSKQETREIDYIEAQIQETGLKSDVIYSFTH